MWRPEQEMAHRKVVFPPNLQRKPKSNSILWVHLNYKYRVSKLSTGAYAEWDFVMVYAAHSIWKLVYTEWKRHQESILSI